jgi:hypothetical protein
MKKFLAVSILAALLVACADSGQGGAPQTDRGANSSSATEINVSEPGVAADPGTRPVISTGAVTEMPARPVPIPEGAETKPALPQAPVQSPAPEEAPQPNEQGAQLSPVPRTGDDANPDSVNPRR